MQASEDRFDILSAVPEIVSEKILSFLDVRDLFSCAQCCHTWRNLIQVDLIWKRKCRAYGFRDISENERTHNYTDHMAKFSCRWQGVFMYNFNLRSNWLRQIVSVNPQPTELQKKIVYFHHLDEKIFIIQVLDYSIRICNSANRETTKILRGLEFFVDSLKISGNTLVTACNRDSTVRIWNLQEEICSCSMESDSGTFVKFDFEDNLVASTKNCRIIRVWRIEEQDVLFLIDNCCAVTDIKIHNSTVFTGCLGGDVNIFSLEDGSFKHSIEGGGGKVKQLWTHPAFFGCVLKIDARLWIKIWNIEDSLLYFDRADGFGLMHSLDDGQKIAWQSSKYAITLFDLQTTQVVQIFEHTNAIVGITSNEDFLFCVDEFGVVVMWDLQTWKIKRFIEVYSDFILHGVHFFKATKTKLALHIVGCNKNSNDLQQPKLLFDFDVLQ